jgi:tetrahydromethanopterin S-methyltransferase subunit G
MPIRANQAQVSNGNAHHNLRSSALSGRVGARVGGGSGTLFGIVTSLFSLIDLSIFASTFGVTVRALLACVLAIGALVVLGGTKPARQDRPNVVQVRTKTTPLYTEPSEKQRKTSAIGLLGGSVLAGALSAIVISVVIAYLVTTLTSLLK